MEVVGSDRQNRAVRSERDLVSAAVALGALDVPGLTESERELLGLFPPDPPPRAEIARLRAEIKSGADPLGDAFCALRSPETRRPLGATYTPPEIVTAMVEWAAGETTPSRIVDPGAGSARFAVAAGRRFPRASVIAVELDPVAALLARGHVAAAGLSSRTQVVLGDFRIFEPPNIDGTTLYVGNPPYVRHHQITPVWKEWLAVTARERGLSASQLAGLHVHFFLATAVRASAEDVGAFVTSAEWLDVNYGALVRDLLLDGLGGLGIHVLEPTVRAFEDAATTAAITCFRLGARPRSLRLRRVKSVEQLGTLREGQLVRRERLLEANRWTPLTRPGRKPPEGYVELGELCRVHRGAVTGSNKTWVVSPEWDELPEEVLFPSVTRARELFAAETALQNTHALRRVVDLPEDLDSFEPAARRLIDRFLRRARSQGVHRGYIAERRRAWWSVGLRQPAPILATYMARRPPTFVRNPAEARHINIAHGLYPRQPLSEPALERLARALRERVTLGDGRTYAGGLTKFEPREMERLHVPSLELIEA